MLFVITAKYWLIFLSSPAFAISSLNIASASLKISNFSSVTSPITLIPKPGPGNGCLKTKYSGILSSKPNLLTSSLNKSLNGSIKSLKSTTSGSPPTL